MLHQLVQDHLEDYLAGRGNPVHRGAVLQHLSGCSECRQVVEAMQLQARWVQALRPRHDAAASPGFYARVLERIESQTPISFWSFFLNPAIGRRLVFASLTLMALLAGIAASTDGDSDVLGPMEIMARHEYAPAPGIDQQQDRDVVLVNLATWHAPGNAHDAGLLPLDSQ
ncbi:MAG: zf-HC2 domain-containing protein [Bryobacterales bacterium]|nr:zf-HC2 domain-containing protein [Bryobacterales bacterium]